MQKLTESQSYNSISCCVLKELYLLLIPAHFTLSESELFKQEFESLCQIIHSPIRIILDFSQTYWIDSSGLVCLRHISQLVQQRDINLECWSISENIQEVLRQAGLFHYFNSHFSTNTIFNSTNPIPCHPSVTSKVKRFIDILGALVGLSITGVLFMPIAIAIQWDNPGPILYSQMRRGYLGKPFRIWKFRSMVANAEKLKSTIRNQASGPIFKNDNDPRITRVGRLLRKTSLDELPQFWNVLLGDMSLVGTRPPTIAEVDQYEIAYGQRLNVKPGLTGEWQVNGRSKITDFAAIVALDLNYQRKWNVFYDIKIIFKTVQMLFNRKNGAC